MQDLKLDSEFLGPMPLPGHMTASLASCVAVLGTDPLTAEMLDHGGRCCSMHHAEAQAGPAPSLFLLLCYFLVLFPLWWEVGSADRKAQTGPSVFAESPPALGLFMDGPAAAFLPIVHTFLTLARG